MEKQYAGDTTPKLRFPKFRAMPAWRVERMDSLYAFMRNNLLSRDKLNYECGLAKNIHYGDIHTKFPMLLDITKEQVPFVNDTEVVAVEGSEDYCVEGDIIFADASEDMNDVGKTIEVIRLNGERLLSGQHTILARRKDESLIIGFGGYLFRSDLIRSRIQIEAQGTKVYQISSSRLGGIDITYPNDTAEQKLIADCLTSLDEVVAAQGRKLEALKAYKRGLMQKLFPREGETCPRLRFPEFRDAPEWGEKPVSELVFTVSPPQKIPTSGYQREGCLAIVDQSPDAVCGWTDDWNARVNAPLPLIVFGDHTCVLKLIEHDFAQGADGIKIISAKFCIDIRFMFYALQADPIVSTSYRRHFSLLLEKKIGFPKEADEQKRIADLLYSLDTQITAETTQLAALKTHKQGLMQQLFPTPKAAIA